MKTDLYFATVPAGDVGRVFPPRRQIQLEETVDENHRRQRYFVWKLLEYGLRQSLGLDLNQMEFSLNDRGRWSCRECFFSLSHSGNALAVAISSAPVGVDIEGLDRALHPGLARKILTEPEQKDYAALEEARQKSFLLKKWCMKESFFKWKEAAPQAAQPKISCAGSLVMAGQEYCYALVAEHPHRLIRLEENEKWN